MCNPYESLNISLSNFLEYLISENDILNIIDNPNYIVRKRLSDNNTKFTFKCLCESIIDNGKSESVINKINDIKNIVDYYDGVQARKDNFLGIDLHPNSVGEKVGYLTYNKEYMVWYDLSDKLVDILSLLSGTNPFIISCLLQNHLNHLRLNISVEDFSRIYLSDNNIFVGLTNVLLDGTPPAVQSILLKIFEIGDNNNYSLKGKTYLSDNIFEISDGRWKIIGKGTLNISKLEVRDIYICCALRILVNYIYSYIYNIIANKYRASWSDARLSQTEMMVSMTLKDIVFQNEFNRDFPAFKLIGRWGTNIILNPFNYTAKDTLLKYVLGELKL